jgi:hypothetical protein
MRPGAAALIRFGAMAAVADLERLFERVFERTTARLFRAHVQVVQLEHRVERAMERARAAEGGRVAVPARYRLRLHPADLADVTERAGGAEALAMHLGEAALAFARSHGYHLAGRPVAWIVADPVLERGQVEVDVQARQAVGPGADRPAEDLPPQVAPTPLTAPASIGSDAGAGWVYASPESRMRAPVVADDADVPAVLDASAAPAGPAAPAVRTSIRGDGTETLVYRRPAPQAARALLRVTGPRAPERTVEVDGSPLSIGRSRDNGLVLDDPRISRLHGRLQARRGTLVYADLGSTNGSRVNGIRVDEIVLGIGDRIQVGDTVLVVETLPG